MTQFRIQNLEPILTKIFGPNLTLQKLSVASSLDKFTDQFQEIQRSETNPQLGFGLMGDNRNVPAGYIIRNILIGGESGVRFLILNLILYHFCNLDRAYIQNIQIFRLKL